MRAVQCDHCEQEVTEHVADRTWLFLDTGVYCPQNQAGHWNLCSWACAVAFCTAKGVNP